MSLVGKWFSTIILVAIIVGFAISMSTNGAAMPFLSKGMLIHMIGLIVPLWLLMWVLKPRKRMHI